VQELFKQFLDRDISRGSLLRGLSAVGMTTAVAGSVAEALAPVKVSAAEAATTGAVTTVRGTGGHLFVQQLKAAGTKYFFFNPSTGDAPIFDAIVNEPSIQLIKGVQEGVVVGMADGYARLSGQTAVASVANIGLPNGMTQLVNTFKDRIPVLLVNAAFGRDRVGRDGSQEYEHAESMMQPITKWYWVSSSTAGIPETTRRALRFASMPPTGPVFLALPDDDLAATASAQIMDQSLFTVPMKIRPDTDQLQQVAKMLLEAKSPFLAVGDEITRCNAQAEVQELAELLGLPAAGGGEFGPWSKPFATMHPLYLGALTKNPRFPGQIDVRLNIGGPFGEVSNPGQKLISMRLDPTSIARNSPVDVAIVCDLKLGVRDLILAVKSAATPARLQQISAERGARVHAYTAAQAKLREAIIRDFPNNGNGPVTLERLAVELESSLDPDTIYVNDVDSGKKMDPFMSFGGKGKTYIANGPNILGWGMSAGAGAKLAQPNRPVVAVLGDGAFMFGGPTPLWSQARYSIPMTNIVLNNFSYNNERNRIWTYDGGDQFRTGLDMTCYNGSPDVDFAKTSQAFGVDAEVVREPGQLKAALARAKRANVNGQPYLLDVHIQRDGVGAGSTWHPPFSVAALRTRKV
jgi:thiamine pyrophosphate-dependent acetolactate synthase large subunit-like protein